MLRPYQSDLVNEIRVALFKKNHRAICVQLPTGGGKTAVVSEISKLIYENNFTAWFIVPRNELLTQASDHFFHWKIPHGKIASGFNESLAYKIHVVSKDTLIRRYDKIKKHPDIIFIDECHIALDRQIEIAKQFPNTKIIGLTATPERTDGRGLSDLYETLIEGPSIPDLTEMGYLAPLRYFAPKIDGLDSLHKRGTEYKADELDLLLKKRAVYGEAVEHYRKYAHEKPALVFCRDVKSAYETADRFTQAGYRFMCIEGKMSYGKRKALINGLKSGELHGLTNCEIATYGLDIPRVEVGICLRPTLSRALYFQMVGRILRKYENKEYAMFFDHVNNLYEHAEPEYPDTPPFYVPHINWNFKGNKKRKREKVDQDAIIGKMCPECWMYFKGNKCDNCGSVAIIKKRKELEQIQTELKESTPVKLNDRPPEERAEYIERIRSANEKGAVDDMLKIADELGRQAMWAYHKLNEVDRISVNVPLLTEIARIKGYKPGWIWMKQKELKWRV